MQEESKDSKKRKVKPSKTLEIHTEEEEQQKRLSNNPMNTERNSANSEQINNPSWDMFQVMAILGEGAYGKVYKVKCLRSSILSGEAKVLTPTMRMRKKLTKNLIGLNIGSTLTRSN